MKNAYRAIVLFLLSVIIYGTIQMNRYANLFEYLSKVVLVTVAGNSYMAGCMNEAIPDPKHTADTFVKEAADTCHARAVKFVEAISNIKKL